MRILSNLIKVRLASFLSGFSRTLGKNRKMSIGGIILIYSVLILSFGMMFASMWASLALTLVPLGFDAAYFTMINLVTFGMIFVLSIFETKSELFECKDNEALLAMPIRPRDIVLSRSVSVIVVNSAIAMISMISALILYVIAGGAWWYIPTAIITLLLVTLLATSLSAAGGYLIAALSARFKNNSVITLAASILLLGLYLVFYPLFTEYLMSIQYTPGAAEDLALSLGLLDFIGKASMLDPLSLLIIVVICVGFALLVWLILSKSYIRIITTRTSGKTKKYVKSAQKSDSLTTALIKKEFGNLFANPTYFLNGAVGLIFQIFMAVALLTTASDLTAVLPMLGIDIANGGLPLCVGAILFGLTSTTSLSASAVSLEGKNYWIVKSAPITTSSLIIAKLVPHASISAGAGLITAILSAIAISAEPLWWIYIIIMPILGSVIFAMLGLILNIVWPKLEFEHITQVVKQSLPVFIMTFGGMLLSVLMVLLSVAISFAIGAASAAFIILAIAIILFIAFYLILFGPSLRRLEKL